MALDHPLSMKSYFYILSR